MTDALKKLREPFPPHQISKLPKPTKAQTDEVKADFKKGIRCDICGSWHHPKVVHLDYVGHAALTDRLLDTDPGWTWEPLAMSPDGLPVMDNMGGMWIKLTVCGVTRLGYGHAGDKTGGDAIKEVIGDALRNAAMRFGAALDLWHKGDLHIEQGDSAAPKNGNPTSDGTQTGTKANRTRVMQIRAAIQGHLAAGRDLGALQEYQGTWKFDAEVTDGVWSGLTTPEQDKLTELLNAEEARQQKAAA